MFSVTLQTRPQRPMGVDNFELQLIDCVQELSQKAWPASSTTAGDLPHLTTHTLSLLHLASALGYARLISTLMGWK